MMFLFAEQHFTEVVGSEEFLNLGMEQVSSLIASDKLTIPTEEKVHTHSPCSVYADLICHYTQLPNVLKLYVCTLGCRFLKQ